MSNLILIPTDFERGVIESLLRYDAEQWSLHTTGFGVVASGITTARLLNQHTPSTVILAGIAGLYSGPASRTHSIGDAIWFDSVSIDGIGVGQGDDFIDAMDLGWNWIGDQNRPGKIQLQNPSTVAHSTLLTVCSGSASGSDADRRLKSYPDAIGEDMESFSVALACQTAGVPLQVIRGFSNVAGDRDKSSWKIDKALRDVATQLQQQLDSHKA